MVGKTVGFKNIVAKTRELRNPTGTTKNGEKYGPWMIVQNKKHKGKVSRSNDRSKQKDVGAGGMNNTSNDMQWKVVSKPNGVVGSTRSGANQFGSRASSS